MAKTLVNLNKKSIKDLPWTGAEIKEMEEIQEKEYWQRKDLKERFCHENHRLIAEVNEYFKKHPQPPLSMRGGKTAGGKQRTPVAPKSSVRAPKDQVTKPQEGVYGMARLASHGEIRIKYKSLRIEGGDIIFEI